MNVKTEFKVGDEVTWTSQAQSFVKTKVGIVVQVVPANTPPSREMFPDLYKGSGVGYDRKHTSYVVRVGKKHYWPLVRNLYSNAD